MQKVFQKQESTEEMFHRRQASLKKLAAKQTRPVQPVAPRPEALTKSPSPSPGILLLLGSQVLLLCMLLALSGPVHGQQPAVQGLSCHPFGLGHTLPRIVSCGCFYALATAELGPFS